MERNVLKKRIKGLLAFMLVFMMMFGSSLTVLAEAYRFNGTALQDSQGNSMNTGILMSDGDSITVAVSGALTVKYSQNGTFQEEGVFGNGQSHQILPGTWKYSALSTEDGRNGTITLAEVNSGIGVAPGGAQPEPDPDSTGNRCKHEYKWVIGIMPTEEKDGRFDYECQHCGSVTAHQPLSFFYAIIWNIMEDIKEAPANGVVTVDNKYLRCLTGEIVETLLARPDVTLDVKFTDNGVPLHFTIPAGKAPVDGEDWYGYYYLGSQYGWIW